MSTITNDKIVQEVGLASYEMSVSINMAQKAFRELLKTCLGHHGLNVPEWTLLGKLYASKSIRPAAASKLLGVKPPFVARLITILKDQELILIKDFADDGRGKQIMLTEKGRDLVEHVEEKLKVCLNEQLGELQRDDLENYFRLTQYIAKNVHHHSN